MKACGSISVSFDLCCNSETVELDLSGQEYMSFEVAFISDFLSIIILRASISDIKNIEIFLSIIILFRLEDYSRIAWALLNIYNFFSRK